MDRLQEKVFDTIKKQAMIPAGSRVIVGLSGGMDSVCLLFVLLSLRSRLHFEIAAVHVNHGLRGEAADADQRFVESLCAAQAIPLKVYRADISQMAAKCGRSIEETGRDFRYQCFEQAMREMQADKVAVAHHRDDVCETLLLNLCRGTGISGLAGIPAVRGFVIRPLIEVSRQEIEDWMTERQQPFCEDATNTEDGYTRNRIRHEILPLLQRSVNAGAALHIADTAGDAAVIRDYLAQEAAALEQEIAEVSADCVRLKTAGLRCAHAALQSELIRRALVHAAGSARDIGRVHIQAVRSLADGPGGRWLDLPYELEAFRDHDSVVIRKKTTRQAICSTFSTALAPPCVMDLPGPGSYRLKMRLLEAGKNPKIPKKRYTKWFDYDRMSHRLTWRTRLADDYLVLSDGSRKKLRRVFIDEKVSREARDGLPLLADGSRIVWIPALDRISDDLKVTPLTKHILEIHLEEINDERESESTDSGSGSE